LGDQSIISTSDGSDSIFSKKYDASYHSKFGALEEAITIFISGGLFHNWLRGKRRLRIFEMGFGTGLNAFLTAIEANRLSMELEYITLENHPLSSHLIPKLNYTQTLGHQNLFEKLHLAPWQEIIEINSNFKLGKFKTKIEEHKHAGVYDLVYYDAFAPSTQSHLWEEAVHGPIFQALRPGGQLLTYCAQGKFKRMLIRLGYKLECLPGPSHKKEIIRATKTV